MPPTAGVQMGRVGIVASPDASNASWTVVPGLADPSQYSIRSLSTSPAFTNQYLTKLSSLSGSCNYPAGAGDVVMSTGTDAAAATWQLLYTPPPPPPNVTIDFSKVIRTIPQSYMGCHFDPGERLLSAVHLLPAGRYEPPSVAALILPTACFLSCACRLHESSSGVLFEHDIR